MDVIYMNIPNNLIQSNNNQNTAVDIDLSALGQDKLNQSISAEPQEKPILETPTEAVVIGIKLQRDGELKFNQNDASKKYYKVRAYVKTQFKHPETGEMVESSDAYGGLRFYPVVDETGTPVLDASGQPQLDRFWSNSATSQYASYFSKLLARAQDFNQDIKSYQDFFAFLESKPKCMILTEFTRFGNSPNQTTKEVIQNFI